MELKDYTRQIIEHMGKNEAVDTVKELEETIDRTQVQVALVQTAWDIAKDLKEARGELEEAKQKIQDLLQEEPKAGTLETQPGVRDTSYDMVVEDMAMAIMKRLDFDWAECDLQMLLEMFIKLTSE